MMRVLASCLWVVLLTAPTFAQDPQLDAADEAHIRQSIDVTWTAPSGDGALLEVRGLEEGARRLTYAYVRGNPQAIAAPEAPGDYVIVFVQGGEDVASHPLSVFIPDASVEAPETLDAGQAFEVPWSGPNSRSDLITIAQRDGDPIRGSSYRYVGTLGDAPANLTAPNDAGAYDVVYVSGSTVLARAPIQVGSISATLSAPTEVHAGGTVRITWEGPANAQDYISFGARDGDPIQGASYRYVVNLNGDTAILTASEETGPVDIIYVSGGRVIGRTPIEITDAQVSITAPDTVEARMQFEVTWEGAGNQGDIIHMVQEGQPLASFRYIDPNDPVVVMGAAAEPGTYDLIYFTRAGREMARRPITVTPAPVAPGQLIVEQARATLGSDDAVGVILDASGSMLQRLGDERRIAIARGTLTDLVSNTIPEGTGFALRVFGHREADSCRTDLEIPLGPLDAASANATIAGVNAMNLARTPIGHSIQLMAGDLADVAGERVLIVLTDGEETCDGDAAAAIQSLRDFGWDIRVNIVGFAIDDEDLAATFQSWAAIGGGSYFTAADGAELAEALASAVATEFEVRDAASDSVIATGTTGDVLTLPPGEYVVTWGADGNLSAAIASNETTRVQLD